MGIKQGIIFINLLHLVTDTQEQFQQMRKMIIYFINHMSFLEKVKSVFRSKKGPTYRNYSPAELKVTAMKTRIVLEQYQRKCNQKIKASDSQLALKKTNPVEGYKVMQEIGHAVIEVECIKIYVELLRKIEDKSPMIIKTNGDIALLKTQLRWFQAILWYRKCYQVKNMEEIWNFCFNFFKGVDVTMEINVKCEVFQIFPYLKYLNPKAVIPLEKMWTELRPYIGHEIPPETLNQIFFINKQEIIKWYKIQRIEKSRSPVKKQEMSPPAKYMVHSAMSTSQKEKQYDHQHEGHRKNLNKTEEINLDYQEPEKKSSFRNLFLKKTLSNQQTNYVPCENEQKNQVQKEAEQIEMVFDDKNQTEIKIQEEIDKQWEDNKKEQETDKKEQALEQEKKNPEPRKEIQPHYLPEKKQIFQNTEIKTPPHTIDTKQYNDEEESLNFIRESIKAKKKGIKKPYMVSIYARAQFVNQIQ